MNHQLELSRSERDLLVELLESELTDVRSENYHAESHEVKELLKAREALVRQLLGRLATEDPPAGAAP